MKYYEVYRRYARAVEERATARLIAEDDVYDVVMDVFFDEKVVNDWFGKQKPSYIIRYLFFICDKKCDEYNEQRSKYISCPFEKLEELEMGSCFCESRSVYENIELRVALERCIDDLRMPYKDIIRLKYIGGYNNDYIGMKIGMAPNTVSKAASRGCDMLAKIVRKNIGDL